MNSSKGFLPNLLHLFGQMFTEHLGIGASRVNKKDMVPSFREQGTVLKEKNRVLGDLPGQRGQKSPPGKYRILTETGKMNRT